MKKEKHPVYRWVLAGFIVLLVLGVLMLISALVLGENWLIPGRMQAI